MIAQEYLAQFNSMQRAKVEAALTRQHRVNGVAEWRYQTAERLAANPAFRIDLDKGRVYTSEDTFFDLTTLTKSLTDYAAWLSIHKEFQS